ncbi:uncharacterized protein [Typha angustifolia]|uniref:uncharacterized protein n=1 Tax=Typha angustifolia TaxID=59011 RepID=UPI003C302EC2
MAVDSKGFSIRAYTAKMRGSDFVKCWPFDGGGNGEENGLLLPPISVRRFRWWSDELQDPRSRHVEAEARVSIKNAASADDAMAETLPTDEAVGSPPRNKQRAPKKRSILELFAVAPPIETIQDEMNGGDLGDAIHQEEEPDQRGGDGVHQERHLITGCRQERRKPVKDDERRGMRRKKLVQKKKVRLDICASEKGKVGKLKRPSSVDKSRGPKHFNCNKQLKNLQRKLVVIQKNKQEKVKCPSKKDKLKYVKSVKPMCKTKELPRVLPLHSILKSWTQAASSEKGKAACCSQDSDLVDISHEPTKHVSFSGVDNILGCGKRCSSTEIPQSLSPSKIVSHVLSPSSSMDKSIVCDKCLPATEEPQVMKVSDNNIATSSVERTADVSFERKQWGDSCGPADPNASTDHCRVSSDTDRELFSGSLDLNSAVQECADFNCSGNANPSLSPSRACSEPKVLNHVHPWIFKCHSDEEILHDERRQRTCDPLKSPSCFSGKSAPCSDTVVSSSPVIDPTLHLTPFEIQGTKNKEQSPSWNPRVDILNLDPEFQLNGHFSPTKFISDAYCSSDSNKYMESRLLADPVFSGRCNRINKERIGLPLTLKGEFNQLPLSSSCSCTELCKRQSSKMDSVHSPSLLYHVEPKSSNYKMKGKFPSVSLSQTDLSNQFLQQYCSSAEATSSGLSFSDHQHFEQLKVQKHNLQNNANSSSCVGPNELEVCCWCSKHNQTQVDNVKFHIERNSGDEFQPALGQTMRLMGKNVTVGISEESRHLYDEKIWTDKVISKERGLSLNVSDNSNLRPWLQEENVSWAGTPNDTPFDSLGDFLISDTHSTCMHLECQPQCISLGGISPSTHPYPAQCSSRSSSSSMVDFLSESSTDGMMHEKSAMSFQNGCQHVLLSSTDCKHSQSVSYTLPSTSLPSFTDHNNSRFTRHLAACFSASLPNWWLTATQQGKMQQSSSHYSVPFSAHHSCSMPSNVFTLLNSFPPRMISFPLYSDGFSQAYGLYTPAPVVHPFSVSSFTASKSGSAANTMYKSQTTNNTSKFSYPNDLDNVNRFKRRPIDRDDICTKTLKKPNLVKEDSSTAGQQRSRGWLHDFTK